MDDDEKLIRKVIDILQSPHRGDSRGRAIALIGIVRAHEREGMEELWIARLSKSILVERVPISDAFKSRESAEKYAESRSDLKLIGIFPIYLPRPGSEKQKVARELEKYYEERSKFLAPSDSRQKLLKRAAELLEAEADDDAGR